MLFERLTHREHELKGDGPRRFFKPEQQKPGQDLRKEVWPGNTG